MKKTLLLLFMAVIGLNVFAEKQIYGVIEKLGACDYYSIKPSDEERDYEQVFQLTLYYGEVTKGEVYTIDPNTSIPEWKGLTTKEFEEENRIGDTYELISRKLTVLKFDESMSDAHPISTSHWFEDMGELKYIFGLEKLNTSKVTDMSHMFAGCSKLRYVDISNFQFTSSTNTNGMFDNCSSLAFIYAPPSLSMINNETLFYGIGNRTSPCYIATPDGYNYNTDISGSFFIYKSGYFVNCENEAYYINTRLNFKSANFDDWRNNVVVKYGKTRIMEELAYSYLCGEGEIEYWSSDGDYFYPCDGSSFHAAWGPIDNKDVYLWNNTLPWREMEYYGDLDDRFNGKDYANGSVDFDPSFANNRLKSTAGWFESVIDAKGDDKDFEYYSDEYRILYFSGLEYVNTSEVTDMSRMFANSSIKSWELKCFDTSKVENMSEMFMHCFGEEIDLSNFNTSNVTNMSGMFYETYVDIIGLNNFDTSNVIDMSSMFACHYRDGEGTNDPSSSLDLSNFNTAKVQDMSYMFSDCSLDTLNISSFDMSNVTNSQGMFEYCFFRHLFINPTMSKLDDEAFKYIGSADCPCTIYAPEDFDFGVDTSGEYFIWKGGYFRLPDAPFPYAILSEDKATLTFKYGKNKYENKIDIYKRLSWSQDKTNITKVVFDKSFEIAHPASISNWFYGMTNLQSIEGLEYLNTDRISSFNSMFNNCSSLKSIDLSHFNTSNATYFGSMFQGCSSLTALDLSNFETAKVTNMTSMFEGCSSLTSLDISNFDTSKVKYLNNMFKGCTALETLDMSNFVVGETTPTAELLSGCSSLKGLFISPTMNLLEPDACLGVGTSTYPCQIKAPSGFDFGVSTTGDYFQWKGGYFSMTAEEYANISADGTTITFYCDGNRSSRQGTTYTIDNTAATPEWLANAATITKAVFDPSFAFARPTTTQRWFSGMKNLKTIEGIENLNTSDVTIMSYMFLNCQSLETLDLSHFDTRKVDKMGYMMQGCTNLKSVDLTGFETAACTSFYQMFKNCSSLESLDLSPLTITEGVESRYVLNGCTSLKSLTIPETAANLNSAAFVTVGTSDAPCELHAPEGFDFGTDTNGAFQWKSGWFYLAVPAALTATVASLSPGSTASLAIGMTNGAATSYNGYEMVLTLPEGMTLAKSGSRFDCTIGDRYSSDDFTVSINDLGGGAYRIIGFSLSNTTITGSDGPLFLLKVTCPEGVATGSYTGTLEDISLSTTAGTGEEPEDVTFPITVSEYRLGDVDLNGKVNVVDVMLVVNRVLGETAANYHDEYADMDGNGKVNVVDIMTIIDVILTSPRTAPMPLTAMTNYNSHLIISPATTGTTMLSLDGTERFTACQMDVRLDGSTTLHGIKLLGTNASTHSVKYFHVGDDLWRVVVYSTKGAALESNAPLLQLITNGSQHASIENIEMCNTAFDTVTLDCIAGTATGIAGTATDADTQQVPTYTIQGIRTDQPQRGVNIRNGVKVTVK